MTLPPRPQSLGEREGDVERERKGGLSIEGHDERGRKRETKREKIAVSGDIRHIENTL